MVLYINHVFYLDEKMKLFNLSLNRLLMADIPDRFPEQHDDCMLAAKALCEELYRNLRFNEDNQSDLFEEMQFGLCLEFVQQMIDMCPDLPMTHVKMIVEEILDRVFLHSIQADED